MSRKAKVKAIRPHLTSGGMRQPGDEYERDAVEAAALAAQDVLEVLADVDAPDDPPPAVRKPRQSKAAPAA